MRSRDAVKMKSAQNFLLERSAPTGRRFLNMWCITLRTLMAKQPPLCPSQSLAIMVQACTSINRYGKTGATSSQEKATRACRVRAPLYRRHYPARARSKCDYKSHNQFIQTSGARFEAPVKLAYSARNRSASIRIPYVSNAQARRIETRFPDPLANPYLAFSALLMAGLDGVQNKIHPGEAADKNLYALSPEEDRKMATVCSSLEQALDCLDQDREFLTRGGVFNDDLIDGYIEMKRAEVTRLRATTHPIEFEMYYSL